MDNSNKRTVMEEIEKLQVELNAIEAEIRKRNVSPEMYETMVLLRQRVTIGKKIAFKQWNQLSEIEKEEFRIKEFNSTLKYYEKFGDEVANKYLYQKYYIEFIDKIKLASRDSSSLRPFLLIILEILNKEPFLDLEDCCVSAILSEIGKSDITNTQIRELTSAYNNVVCIPYEITY